VTGQQLGLTEPNCDDLVAVVHLDDVPEELTRSGLAKTECEQDPAYPEGVEYFHHRRPLYAEGTHWKNHAKTFLGH
jgi:hypothetical protein